MHTFICPILPFPCHFVDEVYARLIDCSLEKWSRMIIVKWMRVTVSAMPPVCRNWQNAYIISISKGLNALKGQAAIVASKEIVHQSRIRWQ
jgi:hypothetical protein